MSEPQDHRIDLPWKVNPEPHEPGSQASVWTEPPIEGAPPLQVLPAIPPADLAAYIVATHNAALHARSHLADASQQADEYMRTQYASMTPHDTVGTERVRDAYVDGYGDGWKASTATGQQQHRDDMAKIESLEKQLASAYRRAEGQSQQVQVLQSQRADLAAAYNQADRDRQQFKNELDVALRDLAALRLRVEALSEDKADLTTELEDLRDDARIACSLSSAPGAREAAMERIRRRSPAIQDQVEQFGRDVEANPLGDRPQLTPPPFGSLGQQEPADAYDKGTPLHGHGHHTPSYAEGYRNGRNDTSMAFREPMDQRDQALYAAHLLLAESVAAREETSGPWQRAVRRWHEEYVTVFGSKDTA